MTEIMIKIFEFINGFIGNYGWTIVVFTILFRLVFSPLDIRSRIGQREYTEKMAAIQPELESLNKLYKDQPDKLMAKTKEVRSKAGVGLMPKGCGMQLLTYPILIAFFAVFRNIAAHQMQQLADIAGDPNQVTHWFQTNNFLWIKNIWMPDTITLKNVFLLEKIPFINGIVGDIVPQGNYISSVFSAIIKDKAPLEAAVANLTPIFNTLKETYSGSNGFFILPLFAGISQYISFKLVPTTTAQTGPQAEQAAKTNKMMQTIFPLIFVFFCLTSSSALAIYWITSNICMMVLNFFVNKYLDRKQAMNFALKEGNHNG